MAGPAGRHPGTAPVRHGPGPLAFVLSACDKLPYLR
jgi:hypothetical protein